MWQSAMVNPGLSARARMEFTAEMTSSITSLKPRALAHKDF